MRAATAYLVGAGTIAAALAIGLGGGIVAGNIMSPTPPKQGPEAPKQEHRVEAPSGNVPSARTASAETPSIAWNEPAKRILYLAGSRAMIEVLDQPVRTESRDTTGTVAPATQQQAAAPPEPQISTVSANARPDEPAKAAAPNERAAAPENAYAKASDADVKRAAAEQRRVERRRRWAARRRHEMREPQEARDRTNWDDIARNVRAGSASRNRASGPRGFPQIGLFGPDDD